MNGYRPAFETNYVYAEIIDGYRADWLRWLFSRKYRETAHCEAAMYANLMVRRGQR